MERSYAQWQMALMYQIAKNGTITVLYMRIHIEFWAAHFCYKYSIKHHSIALSCSTLGGKKMKRENHKILR